MRENIATASRNLVQIKQRAATHLGFRIVRKIGKTVFSRSETISDLLLYPEVACNSELQDLINRLAWYLPDETVLPHQIYIPLESDVDLSEFKKSLEHQKTYTHDHLSIEFIKPGAISEVLESVDRILCHDFYRALRPELFWYISKVEIVDPEFYLTVESDTWPRETKLIRKDMTDYSRKNFKKLEGKSARIDDSYIFATGPSLEKAFDFEFPDKSLKIICNSIVQNDELLAHIDPDVLVFADPVFHFGPSRYAHEFREDAVQTLEKYDCIGVIPDFQQSLLSGQYPSITDQIVGIEPVNSRLPRFPSHNSLDVMATSNIMTLFMIPIASGLTDRVQIIGADGREEDESYFWEHSDIAQYEDEVMETAVKTHPSFFRDRIYTDYYQEHINTLTNMIEYGERHGIEYISLTDSHIPCLSQRQI